MITSRGEVDFRMYLRSEQTPESYNAIRHPANVHLTLLARPEPPPEPE